MKRLNKIAKEIIASDNLTYTQILELKNEADKISKITNSKFPLENFELVWNSEWSYDGLVFDIKTIQDFLDDNAYDTINDLFNYEPDYLLQEFCDKYNFNEDDEVTTDVLTSFAKFVQETGMFTLCDRLACYIFSDGKEFVFWYEC